MHHVLIADDEKDIREICKTYFEFEGYQVTLAENGNEAIGVMDQNIDLMILDIMMPGIDGYEVVNEMKLQQLNIPYIYLTAKTSESDTIYGLMLGADDYVKKPFSPRELVIRAKNILNRIGTEHKEEVSISCGSLTLNSVTKTVEINGHIVPFRIKEFELLWHFVTHIDEAISKTALIEEVWGYEFYEDVNTLNVHIHRIREKFDHHEYQDYTISTVWGLGYKFQRSV
ncbi:response regulator transcription factor [Staphylococcus edaphicus]|uniref:Response regulator SaeR n=1 Tax=Staphylococcus edaphicus TaxID=1955013 RepID=A0A2C6WK63_9STAP|nr:response regulator transcription factor [Staphylococcus edaphicus]PHK48759.1 DNA-binding response regulator [Staphylococcus edaphicus]UQW81683.1 response regulator transcription factor [Staphylococcus edaphicus]